MSCARVLQRFIEPPVTARVALDESSSGAETVNVCEGQ